MKIKKIIRLAIYIFAVISIDACVLIDWASSLTAEEESCYVLFENCSDRRVYVAGYGNQYFTEKDVKPVDSLFGFIGYVESDCVSKELRLWSIPYVDEKEASWNMLFEAYHLEALTIVVANSLDKLDEWFKHRSDSLLLRKYIYTLSELGKERNTVKISYP